MKHAQLLLLLSSTAFADSAGPRPPKAVPLEREPVVRILPVGGELGSRSIEDVTKVVRTPAARYRRCYEIELKKDPAFVTKLTLALAVDVDGRVTTSAVDKRSQMRKDFETCIVQTGKMLRFTKGAAASMTVPFVFTVVMK